MSKCKKKTSSGKKDSPAPKKKSPKLPEVISEGPNGKNPSDKKINRMFVEDLRSFYNSVLGEDIPEELLLALKLKTSLTKEEIDEIERVDRLVDIIIEHAGYTKIKSGRYNEKEILNMVKELDTLSVEIFMEELRIISEKSPFRSVRKAVEEKLSARDYN
jgi:hypothetical protein